MLHIFGGGALSAVYKKKKEKEKENPPAQGWGAKQYCDCFGALYARKLLIHPDTLLLEPLFQIAHFTVENLVVVVLFQLLDITFQLRLLLDNFT